MRLYLDLNCFNRPFDDQRDERVRSETEAIFSILHRIVEGTDSLVWSVALTFENARHPKRDRGAEIALWQRRAAVTARASSDVEHRARVIAATGISPLDAAHLACAEAGAAGVACIRAIFEDPEPARAAARILAAIQGGGAKAG